MKTRYAIASIVLMSCGLEGAVTLSQDIVSINMGVNSYGGGITGYTVTGQSSNNGNTKSFTVVGDYDNDGADDTLTFDLIYNVMLGGSTVNLEDMTGDIFTVDMDSVNLRVDNITMSYADLNTSLISTDFYFTGAFVGGADQIINFSDGVLSYDNNGTNGYNNLETGANFAIATTVTDLDGAGTTVSRVSGTTAGNPAGMGIGFDIVSTPEPTASLLMGLGGLALLSRRQRSE